MHQTTIRFTHPVWADLERVARAQGVSAAQFVRDATLARLAFAEVVTEMRPARERDGGVRQPIAGAAELRRASGAVRAQARLARKRSRATRELAESLKSGNRQREEV